MVAGLVVVSAGVLAGWRAGVFATAASPVAADEATAPARKTAAKAAPAKKATAAKADPGNLAYAAITAWCLAEAGAGDRA